MKADRFGQYLVPVLALLYSAYMIYEQFATPHQTSTRDYALTIGAIAIPLSLAIIVRTAWAGIKGGNADREPKPELSPAEKAKLKQRYIQMVLMLLLTAVLVYFFEQAGYLIGFFVYTVLSLLIVGVRSIKLILGISVGMVAVIHFLFVQWLAVPLPAGLLS